MNAAPIKIGINEAIPNTVPIPINQAEKVLPSLVNIIQHITPIAIPIVNKTFKTIHSTTAVIIKLYHCRKIVVKSSSRLINGFARSTCKSIEGVIKRCDIKFHCYPSIKQCCL